MSHSCAGVNGPGCGPSGSRRWRAGRGLARPVPRIDLPIDKDWAWGGATGAGVVVAVVDSGIDAAHPEVGAVDRAIALQWRSPTRRRSPASSWCARRTTFWRRRSPLSSPRSSRSPRMTGKIRSRSTPTPRRRQISVRPASMCGCRPPGRENPAQPAARGRRQHPARAQPGAAGAPGRRQQAERQHRAARLRTPGLDRGARPGHHGKAGGRTEPVRRP